MADKILISSNPRTILIISSVFMGGTETPDDTDDFALIDQSMSRNLTMSTDLIEGMGHCDSVSVQETSAEVARASKKKTKLLQHDCTLHSSLPCKCKALSIQLHLVK